MIKLYFTLLFASYVSCNDFVPFLTWTNMRGLSCERLPQGVGMELSYILNKDYLQCLASGNPSKLFVFSIDQLSIEDFTMLGRNDGQYRNIKSFIKSEASSVVAPSVQPTNMMENIESLTRRYLPDVDMEVVHVKLDRSDEDALSSSISSMDSEVGRKLNTSTKYIAVLTSEQSVKRSEAIQLRRVRRQAVATNPNNTEVLIKGPCIYMKYSAVMLTIGTVRVALVPKADPTQDTNCTNPVNVLKLSLQSKAGEAADVQADISMNFTMKYFPMSAMNWWYLANVTVDYTQDKDSSSSNTTSTMLKDRSFRNLISAPQNWSLVCGNPDNMTRIFAKIQDGTNLFLEFKNLQVQPFDVIDGSFSRAVDCQGWFSIGIWTGLIITLLLLTILTMGLCMVAQISTMDRFDDPKGKPLSIPQND
uniref:V-type proton ATPase subunit S1 n=2 Tax=Ciona savignyi TaxID=51511 RepID=H2Y9Q9_CIOSA